MEEYCDLDLTVPAFRQVLDEPEFLSLRAGAVLQACLPDLHRVQRALMACGRRSRGGAPIKLRIVKGANLGPWSHRSRRPRLGPRPRTNQTRGRRQPHGSGFAQRPVNLGGRFSLKARTPSA